MEGNLFERLKKTQTLQVNTKLTQNIFFQINFDDYGAHLNVVDEKYNLVEVDYRQYSGNTREVLRNVEYIKDKSAFAIDWEKDSDNIYLAEYDYLLWQLKLCDNVIDHKGKKIKFESNEAKLILSIQETEQEKELQGKIDLTAGGQVFAKSQPLTESYFLAKNLIFQVEPIGNNFNRLTLFETVFPIPFLEKYLTLFTSYFQNIEIQYQEFNTILSPDLVYPVPSLFFEKIDEENSLYMKVSQVLPNFEYDFLDNYDVDKIALVNDLEQTITLKNIQHQPLNQLIEDIKKNIQGKKKSAVFQDENLLIIPEDLAVGFIRSQLPTLLTTYQVFGAEKLKSYKITAVTPKLSLSIGSGIDFLEGEASLEIEGQSYSLFDVINQYNKQKYIQLNDGTQAVLNEKYIKRLERLFKKQKGGKVKISFFDLPLVEEMIEEKMSNEAFERSREVFEGFNKIKSQRFKAPKAVNAELRPYQQQGVKWLNYLHEQKLGGCLADDMGLGKTLQTITLLSNIYPKETKPTLIVMPKSLLFNWEKEVEKFNPQLTYYTYYQQNRDIEEAVKHHLIFTTYAILRIDIEKFNEKDFYYVILDESQNIKNLLSQTTKAVMLLNADNRLALSGTPVENNLTELYSLFRFLNPAMFGSLEDFNQSYTYPIQAGSDKETAGELRRKIYPFILRRLKKHVLKELPAKVEQILYVEMSAEQKKLYEDRRQYFYQFLRTQIGKEGIEKSQFYILQALTELRQIASVPEARTDGKIISSKREALMENLLDAAANGHKCLVFATFLNAIEVIGEELNNSGIDYVSMTGATRNRQELVDRFQNDKSCRVFLMTLKTGGVGLNLTSADMVYIYDPWWNIAAENQAIDRTHRIGQEKTVFSYKLITKGTIEEKILQLQEQKRELFDNIIASDSASIKSLNESDIDFMLG
jgi:SNF2 family DNA or RNA helicase